MDLESIKATVARLTVAGEPVQGTAFLVAPDLVLTCAHCLETRSGQHADGADLEFTEWKTPDRTRHAFVLGEEALDLQNDIALLRLTAPAADGIRPLPLANTALRGDDWGTFGYPSPMGSDGVPFEGTIIDPVARAWDKPAISLRSSGARYRLNGVSGAPVVSEDRVVGVIGKQAAQFSEAGVATPAFETVYALSLGEVEAWLKRLGPDLAIEDRGPFGALALGLDRAASSAMDYLRYYVGEGAPFGGRNDKLRDLDNWLDEREEPFAVLAAASGQGKSALVTHWSERVRSERRAHVVLVPVSLRFNTASLPSVAAMLLGRLRHLRGIGGALPGGTESVIREVSALLARDRAPTEDRVVVVLDGMDEAANWELKDLELPSTPRVGLKILIATRWSGPASEVSAQHGWKPSQVATINGLAPLRKDGVAQAVASVLPKARALSATLTGLSQGDPLLLRLYIDEILERKARGIEPRPADLAGLKPGWREYIRAWWRDQQVLWGRKGWPNAKVAALVGLLTRAAGAVSRDDLIAASKALEAEGRLNPIDLDTAIEAVMRFVTRVSTRGGEVGYTLSHPRLPEFLADHLRDIRFDLDACEAGFRAYCRQTIDKLLKHELVAEQLPQYVLDQAAEHARRSGDALAFRGLASEAWRTARLARGGSDAAFLDDVGALLHTARVRARQLLGTAGGPLSELGGLIGIENRCALIEASVVSHMSHWTAAVFAAMVAAGRQTPADAYKLVRATSRNSGTDHRLAKQVAALAPYLDDALLSAASKEQGLDAVSRVPLLCELLVRGREDGQTRSLLAKAVRELGRSRRHAAEYWWALQFVLPCLPERNRARHARLAISRRRQLSHPAKAFRCASAVAIQMGEPERGALLREILDASHDEVPAIWEFAPSVLAMVAPHVGGIDAGRILDALDRIQDRGLRERRTAECAPRLAEMGFGEQTLQRVMTMQDPLCRTKALASLSRFFPARALLREAELSRPSEIGDRELAVAARLRIVAQVKDTAPEKAIRGAQAAARTAFESVLTRPNLTWEAREAFEVFISGAPASRLRPVVRRAGEEQREAIEAKLAAMAVEASLRSARSRRAAWSRAKKSGDTGEIEGLLPRVATQDPGDALDFALSRLASGHFRALEEVAPWLNKRQAERAWRALGERVQRVSHHLVDAEAPARTRIEALLAEKLSDRRREVLSDLIRNARAVRVPPDADGPDDSDLREIEWSVTEPLLIVASYLDGVQRREALRAIADLPVPLELNALVDVAARVRSAAARREFFADALAVIPEPRWHPRAEIDSDSWQMNGVPKALLYSHWERILGEKPLPRWKLLSVIARSAVFVERIGGETAVRETATAIEDVQRWWP